MSDETIDRLAVVWSFVAALAIVGVHPMSQVVVLAAGCSIGLVARGIWSKKRGARRAP